MALENPIQMEVWSETSSVNGDSSIAMFDSQRVLSFVPISYHLERVDVSLRLSPGQGACVLRTLFPTHSWCFSCSSLNRWTPYGGLPNWGGPKSFQVMNDHFSLETESHGDLGILRLKNPLIWSSNHAWVADRPAAVPALVVVLWTPCRDCQLMCCKVAWMLSVDLSCHS